VEFNTWVISLLIDSSWRSSLCFHTVHLGGDCLESWLLPFFSNSVLTNSSNSNNEAEPQSSRGKARSVTIVLWSLTRRDYRPCWPSLSRPALFWRCHHWFPLCLAFQIAAHVFITSANCQEVSSCTGATDRISNDDRKEADWDE
jgi:hypothetical protein